MHKKDIIFLIFLIVILFGLYWKTFNYELIWDDEVFFKYNLLFIENHPLSSAFKFGYFSEQLGVQNQDHYYRPLLTASFLLENKLWGIHATTLRITNLVIFILSLVFLYAFLKTQWDKNYLPEIATLLFALFPLNIDNIVWVVGRGDLLLLLWAALTFLCLECYLRKRNPLFLLGSLFFYLLGMLSKETFLLFFPLLLLYELSRRKKITWIYHLGNLGLTLFVFFIKNAVLGLKSLALSDSAFSFRSLEQMVGTAGYYFRTIVFPFAYDMFLPLDRMMGIFYLGFGLLALLFILFLFFLAKKDRGFWLPAGIFGVFLAGHVPLIFTTIYPYQIYSRYMMIAAFGFAWILASFLTRIKEKTRLSIVLLLLIAFIPSLIISANSYSSKRAFWQRALKSSPDDPYALMQSAKTNYENNDYLSAELALNKSLSLSMKRETAIMVSLLYADIELARADYEKLLRWLNSIEEFERDPQVRIAPFIKYQINAKKAQVYLSRGDLAAAEKLLTENIAAYSTLKDAHSALYNLYTSTEQWEKAGRVEKTMKEIFPNYFARIDTARMKTEYETLPFEKKMSLFIQNRNFSAAIALVNTMPALDLDHQLLLAKLYYYQGNPEAGEKIISSILGNNPDDPEILKRVGYFYLSNLIRVREALPFFEKSLSLNPSQSEISYTVNQLKNNYLAKLKNPWK
jgi:tetratricopeptide (TPR) repeat protein